MTFFCCQLHLDNIYIHKTLQLLLHYPLGLYFCNIETKVTEAEYPATLELSKDKTLKHQILPLTFSNIVNSELKTI